MEEIYLHYQRCWGWGYVARQWTAGPVGELGSDFRVLEFAPRPGRDMWTYATAGMSIVPEAESTHGLEIHLFAPRASEAHVELLTVIAHYHITGEQLGLGHTVSFGRPWCPESRCSYGLVSLPYLDGPELEWLGGPETGTRFLWLIPITGAERNYKIEQGLEALERLFDRGGLNYADPNRRSVV